MSEYYDVYRMRAGHYGLTPQQKALKSGEREFRRFKKYSEHTVRGLECGEKVFDAVILEHKQNEYETSMKLLTETCVGLSVGNMFLWNNENWMIWYKTVSAYNPHDKFEIVKCNNIINWVDEDGNFQSSPCYIIGTKDSKIKENFRTWNELITPQPNKFIEVIMPYKHILKNTEIIVFDEAWRLVEYDKNSVPGIIYLSFTETKINESTDDLTQQLANADKLTAWTIAAPNRISMNVGDVIKLDATISKNGVPQTNLFPTVYPSPEVEYDEQNHTIKLLEETDTAIALVYKDAFVEVNISVDGGENGYIVGKDYIRMTRSEKYVLKIGDEIVEDLEFSIDNPELATVISQKNSCIVSSNRKNKVGTVKLSVEYNNVVYIKEINIISLW